MFREYEQGDIIDNYNLFVEVIANTGLKAKLFKLNKEGSCNGLTYAYKMYVHQGQREEYVLALMFIASLKHESQLNKLIEQYQQAEREGKEFIIPIKNHQLNFRKMITMLEMIHFSQDNASLNEIGVLWDKTYSFICKQNELVTHLKNMNLQDGQSVFISTGTHIFCIEKSKHGFYLFEPNNIDNNAINPLLKTEEALANTIIKNCKNFLSNDYVAFSAVFISYAFNSNPFLENAMQNINNAELDHYPAIKLLYDEYGQKKISRLDCALAIREVLVNEDLLSENFKNILIAINENINELSLFNYDKDSINQTAYVIKVTLLHLISKYNQITFLKKLLDKPDILINQAMTNGITPLFFASLKGHTEIVALFLNRKDCLINQATINGATPLLIASQLGHTEIVALLINHGALIDVGVEAKITILMNEAKRNDRDKVFNNILKSKYNNIIPSSLPNFTPLHAAIFFGHEKNVDALLNANADIHAKTGELSCLELARIMNHTKIINLLEDKLVLQENVVSVKNK